MAAQWRPRARVSVFPGGHPLDPWRGRSGKYRRRKAKQNDNMSWTLRNLWNMALQDAGGLWCHFLAKICDSLQELQRLCGGSGWRQPPRNYSTRGPPHPGPTSIQKFCSGRLAPLGFCARRVELLDCLDCLGCF